MDELLVFVASTEVEAFAREDCFCPVFVFFYDLCDEAHLFYVNFQPPWVLHILINHLTDQLLLLLAKRIPPAFVFLVVLMERCFFV